MRSRPVIRSIQRVSYSPANDKALFHHLHVVTRPTSTQRTTPGVSEPLSISQIDKLLSTSPWDANSPSSSKSPTIEQSTSATQEISPAKLRHLLRLSALPPPRSEAEESRMLEQLERQLQFVRQIQSVDVEGVEPLARIEDETDEARKENMASLESMKEELDREIWRGKWNRRIVGRRPKKTAEDEEEQGWDVLGQAGKRMGRFFVVEGGKGQSAEG